MKEFYILFVEDKEVAKDLIKQHCQMGGPITYAQIVDSEKRAEVVEALNPF